MLASVAVYPNPRVERLFNLTFIAQASSNNAQIFGRKSQLEVVGDQELLSKFKGDFSTGWMTRCRMTRCRIPRTVFLGSEERSAFDFAVFLVPVGGTASRAGPISLEIMTFFLNAGRVKDVFLFRTRAPKIPMWAQLQQEDAHASDDVQS